MSAEPTREQVERFVERLREEAESGGYHVNPDAGDVSMLAEGLLANEGRYGYQLCPCRLSEGSREADLDVICPCDYRDLDLEEFDCCY